VVLFRELRSAGWKRWLGVLGGAVFMFGGATLLAIASTHQAAPGTAMLGIAAALGAGALWGTMYIPYRKAYLTGMNPLSFVTFFTIGELATMILLALNYHGARQLEKELIDAKGILFWLMLGGFVWVIGDLFQQYATKYVGISRGIPLSNTNQLWGLLWGVFVFRELKSAGPGVLGQAVTGSILMALGAVAIALSSATEREHSSWRRAADREERRYGIESEYVRAGMAGEVYKTQSGGRTVVDWLLIAGTTGIFIVLAAIAKIPQVAFRFGWALLLVVAMLILLAGCGLTLWRTTRFR
jgi:drug/metabolite transporter (DMT)-like permease